LKFKQNLLQNLRGIQVIINIIKSLLNNMESTKTNSTKIYEIQQCETINNENEKFFEVMKICYSIILFYCMKNVENQKSIIIYKCLQNILYKKY